MLYLPGGGATLFLAGEGHGNYEKEKRTRRYLQGTAVSFQVVIGLWKLKETAALKSSRRSIGVLNYLLYDGFFSFAVVRQTFNYLQFLPQHYGLQRFQPHRTISFWLWKDYFPIHQLFRTRPF